MSGSPDDDRREPSADPVAGLRPAMRGGLRVELKKRPDFVRVARGGRVHAGSMTLQIFRRPEEPDAGPRFGLTVTRKVGGAVERNRIKRRLRQALQAPGMAPQAGHDYVIVARRDALTMPFARLVADLVRLVNRAREGRARTRGEPRGAASLQVPSVA